MATESAAGGHGLPHWFTAPGETDTYIWLAFAIVCLALYGIVTLYAAFERWAEHHSQNTPLAKTIPTLLMIALLYEIFPLDHFHPFLPLSAILLALATDIASFLRKGPQPQDSPPDDAAPPADRNDLA